MTLRKGPAGVEEQGMGTWGDTRNLGDPAVSTINTVVGEATTQITPVHRVGVDPWGRYEQPAQGGTAKRRQRSAVG